MIIGHVINRFSIIQAARSGCSIPMRKVSLWVCLFEFPHFSLKHFFSFLKLAFFAFSFSDATALSVEMLFLILGKHSEQKMNGMDCDADYILAGLLHF